MNLLMPPLAATSLHYPFGKKSSSSFIMNDGFYDDHLSIMSTSTTTTNEGFKIPIPLIPILQTNYINNSFNRVKRTNSSRSSLNKKININNNTGNNYGVNLDITKFHRYMSSMNTNGYKIVEEEYINMTNQQQRNQYQYGDLKQNGGGTNGDIHGDGYGAQRRPSFKRHVTVPFGLSQQDGGTQGLGVQRSMSAQNIHVDSRLAESERNLNYCVRFAVNGLSKSHMGGIPSINKNIQAGDFGDDSGMIAENSKCIVIGLADGAGGNRDIGIDPKKFSRSLLGYCVEIIKNEEVLPHQLSRLATKAIQYLEGRNIIGSGTLCLLSLNKETNIMSTLNLGDSGFRLVRQGKIRHKSSATMAGSSPRQVFVTESRYSGISFVDENDIGRDADLREFRVKKGDIIVMSSDGLFDVLPDQEIERVVNSHNTKDLQGIADELLQLSMRSYLHTHRDDILVMVCRVELKKTFM